MLHNTPCPYISFLFLKNMETGGRILKGWDENNLVNQEQTKSTAWLPDIWGAAVLAGEGWLQSNVSISPGLLGEHFISN